MPVLPLILLQILPINVVLCFNCRCNGHLQGGASAGTAAGPGPRTNGEHRGPGRKGDGPATSDLFSEINLTEFQKLKQQLMTVGLLSHHSCIMFSNKSLNSIQYFFF